MKPKIFCFLYNKKPVSIPYESTVDYVTVQCGAKVNGNLHIADILDDIDGEKTISALNREFGEVTGISAVSNCTQLLDECEYVGFSHYRRFLNVENVDFCGNVIIGSTQRCTETLYEQYAKCHKIEALDTLLSELSSNGSDEFLGFDKFMRESGEFISRNCFISDVDTMKRYLSFAKASIMSIVHIMGKFDDSNWRHDAYQQRFCGFLFERLTGFWLKREIANGIRFIECAINKTE